MPAPRGRDLEQTRKQLLEWLAVARPGLEAPRITNLAGPGTTGFSNDTLLCDLEYRASGRDAREAWVVRIEPSGLPVFPEYDLGRQFRVQQILGGTDVPVAPMLYEERDPGYLGAPFYVMARVEGRIPDDNPPYHVGGWVTEIPAEERSDLWWSGLDVLTRIHRLDWQGLGLAFLAQPGRGATPIERQLSYYEAYLHWSAEGAVHPICDPALAWLREHAPRDEPVALCWGDARIGNMIFRDGRCVAVLDWEMATLGNPEQDLGWWLFLDRHHSEGVGAERLPGFPGRDETVARWEEALGRPSRNLHYYEAFAAFRFSVIMMRLAQVMKAYDVLPEDSDFHVNNIPSRLLARLLDLEMPGST